MLPILSKSSRRVEINALFIQPSYACVGNCRNCYLKQHVPAGPRIVMKKEEAALLFGYIQSAQAITVNQITLSVNKPTHETMPSETAILTDFVWMAPGGENHITIQNPRELAFALTNESCKKMVENRIVASFSVTWPLRSIHSLRTNFNHMAPMIKQVREDEIKKISTILETVDTMYLVLKKKPKGSPRTLSSHREEIEWMSDYIDFVEYLKKGLSPELWRKIHLDDCLLSVIKSRDTGYGCSSGVSRFQLWPDGAVSGCPYAWKAQTGPADTAKEMIANIKEARDEHPYDFHTCQLPSVYERVLQQRGTKNLARGLDGII